MRVVVLTAIQQPTVDIRRAAVAVCIARRTNNDRLRRHGGHRHRARPAREDAGRRDDTHLPAAAEDLLAEASRLQIPVRTVDAFDPAGAAAVQRRRGERAQVADALETYEILSSDGRGCPSR
jgi:hypothetical protein